MNKKMYVFFLFSLCLLFSCPLSALAAGDTYLEIDPDDASALLNYTVNEQVESLEQSAAAYQVYSPVMASVTEESASFTPTITLSGTELTPEYKGYSWLNWNENSTGYTYQNLIDQWSDELQTAIQNRTQYFNLSQINYIDYQYVISGFQNNNTYDGVIAFTITHPRVPAQAMQIQYQLPSYVSTSYFRDMSFNVNSDIYPTKISAKNAIGTDFPVYFSRTRDDNFYYNTFYVVLTNCYIGSSNGVVDVNNIVLDIRWSVSTSLNCSYIRDADSGSNPVPPTFYQVFTPMWYQGRSFSGVKRAGYHDFSSGSADQRQDQLVNGFDSSAGDSANSDLQSGFSSYESEEAVAQQDFSDKMDSYEYPDTSSFVSGISFVSSCMTSWFTNLGMFQVVLLVAFGLMIFNFISRYRGG